MVKEHSHYAHQRGEIKESAVKALVTDPLFKSRVEKNRKGKGSYRRHEKHKNAGYIKGETPFKNIRLESSYMGFYYFNILLIV
ncbi:alternative ribosome-rescue factor A [Mannheimia granulomatis]|uniref:alternative ribosome-rescue factor A n=1 Tax=Mannheimia granulomatis TaxID=85402 RepID=UPI00047A8CC4|nr:ribosome alternative rescue factor ArfA [Mannheimia granulomatis]QLB18963.1 hypothetical protein A6B41_05640 [Mannheimia granulomatis]